MVENLTGAIGSEASDPRPEAVSGWGRYWAMVLFLLAVTAASALVEVVFIVTNSGLSIFDGRDAGQISLYATGLLCVVIGTVWPFGDRPFAWMAFYLRNWRRGLKGLLYFAGIAILPSFAAFAIAAMMGAVEPASEQPDDLLQRFFLGFLPLAVVAMVLATTEESLFRGFLMRQLRFSTAFPVTVAAFVFSAVVFTFVHHLENPANWLTRAGIQLFIGLFLLAIVLNLIYVITRSITCGIGLHGGFVIMEYLRTQTDLIQLSNGAWWQAVGQDVRTAPLCWLLFILIGLFVWWRRERLEARFSLEPEVVARTPLPVEPIRS